MILPETAYVSGGLDSFAVDPTSGRLLLSMTDGEKRHLVWHNSSGRNHEVLLSEPGLHVHDPSISPDGSHVLYVETRYSIGSCVQSESRLMLYDLGSGSREAVGPTAQYIMRPLWVTLSDIVYNAFNGRDCVWYYPFGLDSGSLWRANLTTGDPTLLVEDRYYAYQAVASVIDRGHGLLINDPMPTRVSLIDGSISPFLDLTRAGASSPRMACGEGDGTKYAFLDYLGEALDQDPQVHLIDVSTQQTWTTETSFDYRFACYYAATDEVLIHEGMAAGQPGKLWSWQPPRAPELIQVA